MLNSKPLKLAASAAVFALSLSAAAVAQDTTIKIGTEGAYPPFNNLTASGELEGFDVDIARALCEEMKATCEFVTQDWDGIIPALQAERFDAIVASMSITDERKQQVDFTNPYYSNSLVFVAPKDSEFSASAETDAAIGVQQGTIAADFAEANYANADVRAYPTQVEAWADLNNGRVDAVLGDFGVQHGYVNSEEGACCEFKGEPVSSDDKIGIAVRKGDTELANKFNAALEAIRANGKYKEINDKYFPFDVYGG
ncbi:ABC transporter substrate-binding protein [Tianweitania sediminis]|jgi:polar amino acid transport system substrate-binding protein|uniref:ABC transporter substrate-binding protein n=1 Tax=Tianweitania sediminis TaxID=1502156 RepID=A0A8J7R0L2_9HYPH|nr:ABC transporter substrate-binding protein [Tianweitania sediminis]MBP0439730.1 ABC transporter substrate-binding protein [Tianweitania sediminis]HEV7415088.1 ABC transporter substrate-binding protein [Tianweitania sediminis]